MECIGMGCCSPWYVALECALCSVAVRQRSRISVNVRSLMIAMVGTSPCVVIYSCHGDDDVFDSFLPTVSGRFGLELESLV